MTLDWLKGIRVAVIGHYVPAPLAGWLLQVLGAEIIRIEPPTGDFMRQQPPFASHDGKSQSVLFQTLNAGTESIALNLRDPQGIHILQSLLGHCQILLDGNRAGFMEKLMGGQLSEKIPQLIHISITGLGETGPLRDFAAHDNNALALAGLLSYTSPGESGGPAPFAAPVADMLSAFTAALCAVASLQNADSPIRKVDASILHSALFLNLLQIPALSTHPNPPVYGKEWMNGGLPQYHPYPTADGRFVFFGPIEPHLFSRFLQLIGRMDLLELARRAPEETISALAEIFRGRSMDEWEAFGIENDVCLTPVLNLKEAMDHPQNQALGVAQQVVHPEFGGMVFPAFPAGFGKESAMPERPVLSPEIGSHSRKICCDLLGFSADQFNEWVAAGIIVGK